MQLPIEDRSLQTKPELEDRLAILLGGRAAEEIVFGQVTTGAHNDIERASQIARHMVYELGMSERVGPVSFVQDGGGRYLRGADPFGGRGVPVSEATATLLDSEVSIFVRDAHDRAVDLLKTHRDGLERLAAIVREKESLEGRPTMPPSEPLKLYFDYKSPFAYLAKDPAFALPERHAVTLRWIPFVLRIKGPLKVYDSTPALIGGLFAMREGFFRPYTDAVYRRFFERRLEIDQPEAIAALIAELGGSARDYVAWRDGDGAVEFEACQREAEEDHVFGVPLFVFRGEPFWGHDRMPLLEERLAEAGLATS
jgi:2-hydroxychromene-2-carboxylate isomerase